jgi:hypothetical protein
MLNIFMATYDYALQELDEWLPVRKGLPYAIDYRAFSP